jgi:hypothetical protein
MAPEIWKKKYGAAGFQMLKTFCHWNFSIFMLEIELAIWKVKV